MKPAAEAPRSFFALVTVLFPRRVAYFAVGSRFQIAPTVSTHTEFERGKEDGTIFYGKWMADRTFLLVPAQPIVGEFLKTFKEFPPRQRPASFSIDQALENAREAQDKMTVAAGGAAPTKATKPARAPEVAGAGV